MYGYSYQPPPTVGFHRDFELVDRTYAHAPTHVVDPYSEKEIVEIPAWPLRAIDHTYIRTLFADSGLAWEQFEEIDGIVLAPNLRTSEETAGFARVMRHISQRGLTIGYKPHPRLEEPVHHLQKHVTLMPQHVPVELLLMSLPAASFILATKSTALLTSQWIQDDIVAISVNNLVLDNQIDDIYQKVGVENPSSFEETIGLIVQSSTLR
jgi:hypothetical protein